ncbi:MAG TPA: VWA domain-containing protein [Thermoanaerobaculia bacterium]|nr:VWA domain-containing protein [Thermoanaerobaculia bacterium]
MKRSHLLAVLSAILLIAALVAPVWGAPSDSSLPGAHQQEQEKEQEKEKEKKKDKKQRGKVVKATVVPSEPETEEKTDEETTEETSAEEATSEDEDEAAVAETESKAERREAQKADKADKKAEKDAARAEREREREAEREAAADRAAAERERKEREAAERAADRQAEGESPVVSAIPEPATPSPRATEVAPRPADPPRAEPPAQQQPRDTFQERIQVREVLLDVLVTDRRGNPVVGLGPEDFIVTEDGEQREITGVTYYGGVGELSGSGVEGESRSDRYFIVFFHDQKQAAPFLTAAQMETGRWAKRWIDQLLPNDQVAVMGYDVRLKLYQDFTRDKAAIVQAIEDASLGKKEPDRWKTVSDPELDPDSPSLAVNLPTGKTLARQSRKLQQALELVGEAAEGIVGRKNLLLFSVGFGDIDDFGLYTPDPRYYPQMKQALNNGNVAVYAIDTVGSRRGNPGARDINDSLSAIANDTDGHYYSTFINALTPLEQVAEDNIGYYLLSYRAEYETGTSGYREVEVDTQDSSFRVRARKGYKYGADS